MSLHVRNLDWDGCFNVRDLGGLSAGDGFETIPGALIRADSPHRLTSVGWEKLWVHGIRTVVDLRNDDELNRDAVARPSSLNTVRIAHDAVEDTLGSLDVEARLRDGGLTDSDLAALRERMLTPSAASA